MVLTSLAGIVYAIWTNFDYLKVRGQMIADDFWPTKLTTDIERRYAQETLQGGEIVSFRECTMCPIMIVVPKDEFMMGSPMSEKGHTAAEEPRHRVTIAGNFTAGKFEVTFDEWDACVDARVCETVPDNHWGRGTRPVMNVSWVDAREYVDWLSKVTGKPYRLLSEAEWEYAARAGSTTAYAWGTTNFVIRLLRNPTTDALGLCAL
jgi:formylglycine-generating enzyme required for sulfatase activity